MARIFISYARADGLEIAKELHHRLLSLGHDAFWDIDSIRAGTRWREELKRKVKWADLIVVLVTPKSNDSDYVFEEVSHAAEIGKPIIPVQVDNTLLPVHLRGVWHAIKFENNNYDAVLLQLERSLKEIPSARFSSKYLLLGILIITVLGIGLVFLLRQVNDPNDSGQEREATITDEPNIASETSTVTYTPTEMATQPPTLPLSTATTLVAGTVLLFENFEDGFAQEFEPASAEKDRWQIREVEGDMVYEVAKSDGIPAIFFGSKEWTNYSVEYSFKFRDCNDPDCLGTFLHFRRNGDVGTSYALGIFPYIAQIELFIITNDTDWKSIVKTEKNFETDVWYKILLEAKGSEISVFVDDIPTLATTDDHYLSGSLDLGVYANVQIQFDDIKVTYLGE